MKKLLLLLALLGFPAKADITLVSTTTTQNSGLMDVLLPLFEANTGIHVKLISVGTGEAIEIARRGDADVILTHHRASEDGLLSEGGAINRQDVMHNNFVIIGPNSDPALLRDAVTSADAMARIANTQSLFTGRGDESGTHKREQDLWKSAGIVPSGAWYRETGAGMGATLNIASALDAYVLSDRATWLAFGNKGNLVLLYEGGAELLNRYSIMLVNPAKHPHVHSQEGQRFIDWIISERGQQAIADYRLNGSLMFCPDAVPQVLAVDDYVFCGLNPPEP